MRGQLSRGLAGFVLLGAVSAVLVPAETRAEDRDESAAAIRIGLPDSVVKDVPDSLLRTMTQPFNALMVTHTGLTGQLIKAGDAERLGQELSTGKLDLGIFPGIDFAWVRLKHTDLKPFMIVVNKYPCQRAHLVAAADAPVKSFGDLKGRTLAVPKVRLKHCNLFVERYCLELGNRPEEFLGKIRECSSAEDCLDDVVDGVAQAAVVDAVSLDCYQRRKPGRFARLKTAVKSEPFPAGVVVYHAGGLNKQTLKVFHDGMANANKTVGGRELLALWKITGFEPVPADYDKTLKEIVKKYPPPSSKNVE